MQTLIITLLDLAQIEAGLDQTAQPCEIEGIVLDALRGHNLQAEEKEIKLQARIADDLPEINGQPVRLGQAVSNLVGNALDAVAADGLKPLIISQSARTISLTAIGRARRSMGVAVGLSPDSPSAPATRSKAALRDLPGRPHLKRARQDSNR